MTDPLSPTLRDLIGQRIPGGCADCSAFQVVSRDGLGIWRITVHHDGDCPTWRAKQKRKRTT